MSRTAREGRDSAADGERSELASRTEPGEAGEDGTGLMESSGEGPVRPLVAVRRRSLSAGTAQSPGMERRAAISGDTCGAQLLWMGETVVAPHTRSAAHHHGESETAIYVVAGHPVFSFVDAGEVRRLACEPGDYVYVPPFTPHREENPGDEPALVVLARSTQEAIVVNLPETALAAP